MIVLPTDLRPDGCSFRVSRWRPEKLRRRMLTAFTMTEILVSVSIVVVMAILSFPALEKARLKGREMTSTNNLRSIGQAVASYTSDHGGCYPAAYYGTSVSPFWGEEITPYLSPIPDYKQIQNAQSRVYRVSRTLLDPLVADGLHCRLGDYGANLELFTSPDTSPSGGAVRAPLSVGNITQPSRIISVLSCEQNTGGPRPIASWVLSTYLFVTSGASMPSSQSGPAERGSGWVFCLFADGHTELLSKKDLIEKRRQYFLLNP